MPVYNFRLRDANGDIFHAQDLQMLDFGAACAHVQQVAGELVQCEDMDWRLCCMEIVNSKGAVMLTLPFSLFEARGSDDVTPSFRQAHESGGYYFLQSEERAKAPSRCGA